MAVLTTSWRGEALESAPCTACGELTSLTANTIDELGVICTDCRVDRGARGLPRAVMGWTVGELVHDW